MTQIFRDWQADDIPEITDLVRNHLFVSDYSSEYFAWKFGHNLKYNNEILKTRGLVAIDDSGLVGFAAAFPYKVSDGSVIWNIDDVIVRPDMRRKGIFNGLMSTLLKGIDQRGEDSYLFSSKMALSGYNRLGYETLSSLPYYITVPSWEALLARRGKVPSFVGQLIDTVKPNGKPKCTLQPFEHFSFNKNADTSLRTGQFYISRSEEYINWRFIRNPLKEYKAFTVVCGQNSIGYVVFAGQNIVDFDIPSQYLESLLYLSNKHFIDNNIKMAHCMCLVPKGIEEIFKKTGFINWSIMARPFGLYQTHKIMVRSANNKPGLDLKYKKWVFTMADINCGF